MRLPHLDYKSINNRETLYSTYWDTQNSNIPNQPSVLSFFSAIKVSGKVQMACRFTISYVNTFINIKQSFFLTQPWCSLTFSWVELQKLLSHILYLVYLCPCLGLFMSYLCDLFFIFIFIVNHITFKQTYLFFVHFLEW